MISSAVSFVNGLFSSILRLLQPRKAMKKVIPILLAAFIIVAFQVAVFAAEATFNKAYVDSNIVTYVAGATKTKNTNYANVIINDIYSRRIRKQL